LPDGYRLVFGRLNVFFNNAHLCVHCWVVFIFICLLCILNIIPNLYYYINYSKHKIYEYVKKNFY
jgi:hypothetical protein